MIGDFHEYLYAILYFDDCYQAATEVTVTDAASCPMEKLERILVATDNSLYSEGAIREGIKFASICSSKLFACMTLESNPEYETIGSNIFEKEEADAATHLESIKTRSEKEGVACSIILRVSMDASKVILDEANEKKVDMIVIGRRGYKGLVKALMGEAAAKVIAHAPCKVLVVPKAAQIGYKNILVATDGSSHANAAVTEAIEIAKRCGSHIIVLSAMHDESERDEAKQISDKAVESARKNGVSAESVTPVGKAFTGILETAGGRGVDLIVMGTYGKTGFKKLLMGSATEKVIGTAECAVLVVKA
jgi:nucleotide-binding universal stress UspA family protein